MADDWRWLESITQPEPPTHSLPVHMAWNSHNMAAGFGGGEFQKTQEEAAFRSCRNIPGTTVSELLTPYQIGGHRGMCGHVLKLQQYIIKGKYGSVLLLLAFRMAISSTEICIIKSFVKIISTSLQGSRTQRCQWMSLAIKCKYWSEPGSPVISDPLLLVPSSQRLPGTAVEPCNKAEYIPWGSRGVATKVLETTYYRIWALVGNSGEGLRNWRFTLDWMSESSGKSMIRYFMKSYRGTDRGMDCYNLL